MDIQNEREPLQSIDAFEAVCATCGSRWIAWSNNQWRVYSRCGQEKTRVVLQTDDFEKALLALTIRE